MRFSKTTQCFYPEEFDYPELPADIVDVPREDYVTAMERRPGDTLDLVDGRVVVVPKPALTVAEIKADKWERIKVERDRLIQTGGYPLDGFWLHSDAYSLAQQQGLILAAMQVQASGGDMNAPLMATPWYAMGSVPVVMTASLAMRLLPAAMAQQVAIFEAAKAHKTALEASADPASYDFSGGWPQVFGK